MDVAAIEPGQDFRKAIDQSVASCSVLLAVIGPQWLDARDTAGSRRLDDPGDFVRIELASALRSGVAIVPVLVRGSKMPRPEDLPEDLRDLAYRNAVELTHARWKSDIQLLIRALRPSIGAPARAEAEARPMAPPAKAAPRQQTGSSRVTTASAASAIDPQTLERAGRELARYLGPIANVIVKRAAQRSSSAEALFVTVAREIGSDTDRMEFLRSCRSQVS